MKRVCGAVVLLGLAIAFAENGARYLIITHDNYYQSIQPLAQWKHAKGMMCKVTRLSQIGYDTTAIKNYIRNAYNTWPVRPEYILLVGSPWDLPARYYVIQHGGSYTSDNIYGDMTGDLHVELPVGRFPCRSTAQCDVMVAKTLAYEKTPDLTDSLWMRRLTTVVNENEDPDDTIYWNDVRIAATLAGANNFKSCDSLSKLRGHTATSVVNSVTSGTAMVLYRGSGVGNWYQPFAVNPALTNNGNKLPIILSITCETMTLAPGESMVGDAWVKTGTVANLRGAVAFFGNTHSLQSGTTTVRKRSTVARAFFKALFQEQNYKLGRAIIRAKDSLYQVFADVAEYRGFNLLGDPELDIWTDTPRHPDIEHPAAIQPGPQQFPVTVSLRGAPFAGALVCVSMDTTVYAYGYTDNQGSIILDINPQDTGQLRLVVTGHNLYPYDTQVPVTQVAITEPNPGAIILSGLSAAPVVFTRSVRFSPSAGLPD
ncbi:MAG: C25 family cysteine peptidase, partial [candidate division WOR-3 bacterium]